MEDMRNFALRMNRSMNMVMKAEGTSLAQIKLLTFIRRRQPVRATDISEAFSYAPRTVTEAVDALERAKLVRRSTDANDRRVKNIEITGAGLALMEKVEPLALGFTERLFDALTPRDERLLLLLLKKLNARLEAMAVPEEGEATAASGQEDIDQR